MTAPWSERRWLIPTATIVLLVLGTVMVNLAITLALSEDDQKSPLTGSSTSPSPVPAVPSDLPGAPTGIPSPTVPVDAPIAELADPEWVTATAQQFAVPERALTAYAGASIAVSATHPSCGLGWNTLAAIGLVESEHGNIGGARLHDSGEVTPPILGVPLDGDGVAEIQDTDGGRLDRDKTWDRAVGPMQFIPTTWRAHATDGNGDGTPDIHNIDDAALTAATYLCSSGADLTQPDAWIAAISAYNPDTGYNNAVAEAANLFAGASSNPG